MQLTHKHAFEILPGTHQNRSTNKIESTDH